MLEPGQMFHDRIKMNCTAHPQFYLMTVNASILTLDKSVTLAQATPVLNVTHSHSAETSVITAAESGDIISDELRNVFEIMNFVILSGVISLFGCIANVINIIVLAKKGFTDTVTISLVGLAISDFGALITLVWMSLCFNPLFRHSGISLNTVKVQYLTAGWPHVCFARITSWITAYVTFERCLCIVIPLKVKHIITPRRTIIVIALIFIVLIASVSPVYYAIYLGPVFDRDANRSLVSLIYRENGADIENVSFAINVFAQLSSFVIVIACTTILVQCLLQKASWRKLLIVGRSMPLKEKRLIKMVILLAVIFIVCYLPSGINLIVMILTPGYSIVGKYRNMFQVGWSFLNTLEAINSSVNIIVYYNMSSRYRSVFKKMFFPASKTKECDGNQNDKTTSI